MQHFAQLPLWKEAPFIRLLFPQIAGILIQWYFTSTQNWAFACWWVVLLLLVLILFSSTRFYFRFSYYIGFLLLLFFLLTGATLTYYKYLPNQSSWIGHKYKKDSSLLLIRLEEPLSEKTKSFKSIASVQQLTDHNTSIRVSGNTILYFEKDSFPLPLQYGDQLLITKQLQPIRNTGNPGAFDYRRYCEFQDIYYQVYLTRNDWIKQPTSQANFIKSFLFHIRDKILLILKKFIKGEREVGLAEALFIGYKDDLDKDLVRAYANTGVVHVIAISGLHLGIIYWLLSLLVKPISKRSAIKWLMPVCVIAGLWIFALLTGGSPSVLRSAVMFTFIAIGESSRKKISIYNSLAASAFFLLCYHPFWLWDVGFQLSYIAVLSIVLFNKKIYDLIYIQNKLLDQLWKLTAVTISAQILATPVTIYYFHQFPLSFIVTNLLAIPLSSIILLGEILICLLSWWSFCSSIIGNILNWLIRILNDFIEYIDQLPFASIAQLYISLPQSLILYLIIGLLAGWLNKKVRVYLVTALACIFLFMLINLITSWRILNQQKIIVYNIPRHSAIDFLAGNRNYFYADSKLLLDTSLQNYHLAASRLIHGVRPINIPSEFLPFNGPFQFFGDRILLIDSTFQRFINEEKIVADLVIVSGPLKISVQELLDKVDGKEWVIDASVSQFQADRLQNACNKAGISCYRVSLQGAFVKNLP